MAEPFDRDKIAELYEMVGGDAAWLRELLELYITDTEKNLAELKSLVADGDAVQVARKTHTIKGTSGNVGAQAMFELCLKANRAAQAGDVAAVAALVPAIETAYASTKDDLANALSVAAGG